jgi:hypothetical protein
MLCILLVYWLQQFQHDFVDLLIPAEEDSLVWFLESCICLILCSRCMYRCVAIELWACKSEAKRGAFCATASGYAKFCSVLPFCFLHVPGARPEKHL